MRRVEQEWGQTIGNWGHSMRFERNLSPRTVESYTLDVEAFVGHLMEQHNPPSPSELSRTHIEGYLTVLYDRKAALSSQTRALCALRNLSRWLMEQGVLSAMPTDGTGGAFSHAHRWCLGPQSSSHTPRHTLARGD